MATNDVFGDPCHGVVKYVEAQYQCVPAPACTGNQFRCDDGKCISKSLCNGYPDCLGGEDEWSWDVIIVPHVECARGEVIRFVSGSQR